MDFRQIEFGSAEYRLEYDLRHRVLRVPIGLSLHDEDLSGEAGHLHFGLFEAEQLLACAIAVPTSSVSAKIRQMAVDAQQQNRGLGRILLDHLHRELEAKGLTHFHLHSRITAAVFYEKLGYIRTGSEFTEVGIPHIRMERG